MSNIILNSYTSIQKSKDIQSKLQDIFLSDEVSEINKLKLHVHLNRVRDALKKVNDDKEVKSILNTAAEKYNEKGKSNSIIVRRSR